MLKDSGDYFSTPAPNDSTAFVEYKKKDSKAKAIISLTLSDERLDQVLDFGKNADMWNEICDVFQRKALLNRINARQAFYSVKMREDEETIKAITHVRQLASDLKIMDIIVEEKDISKAILHRLPKQFEHLTVAIDIIVGVRDLTFEFVKSRLLQEKKRLRDNAAENRGNKEEKK